MVTTLLKLYEKLACIKLELPLTQLPDRLSLIILVFVTQ
jgi:hypothetical protein